MSDSSDDEPIIMKKQKLNHANGEIPRTEITEIHGRFSYIAVDMLKLSDQISCLRVLVLAHWRYENRALQVVRSTHCTRSDGGKGTLTWHAHHTSKISTSKTPNNDFNACLHFIWKIAICYLAKP